MKKVVSILLCLIMLLSLMPAVSLGADFECRREITSPPDWVNDPLKTGIKDFEGFYKKCVIVYSIPICATNDVPDEALFKAYDVIEIWLRKIAREYPEIVKNMNKHGVSMIVVGENETNSMHPSWKDWQDKTERRGGGGIVTTVLVEDLIVPESDIWRQTFAGLVHEATHTLLTYGIGDAQNIGARQDIYERILACYENAAAKGMYPSPNEYDASNYHEYFSGQVGRFFNGSPTELPVENAAFLTDREELECYDPDIYKICTELFGLYELPEPWGTGINKEEKDEAMLSTNSLQMKIGEYGQIESLKIIDDINENFSDTEYVLNAKNAPNQGKSDEHNWMGELCFTTVRDGVQTEFKTSEQKRTIDTEDGKITVTYQGDFKVVETYRVEGDSIVWETEVTNDKDSPLVIEDWGMPMPFNQYWTPVYHGEELYDTRCVYHSFVGKNSSYIYATRPSGQGKMLLFTPVAKTQAGFEYRDHWRLNNGHANSVWAQDQAGYHSGLDVFYIHSENIQKTGSNYMESTSLTLKGGESKKYAFKFTSVDNEEDLKSTLYKNGIIDAVAVPSMAFATDMPAKFYLHANDNITINDVYGKCVHETRLFSTQKNMVNNNHECTGQAEIAFCETVTYKNEKYHVYDIKLNCLGANHVFVDYTLNGEQRETMLQFYAMEPLGEAIDRRSEFLTKHQTNTPGKVGDKTFDDWMMDAKANRADITDGYWDMSYWGYGDDWALTHGEYLAQKNVYMPVESQVKAVDEYLDVAIWQTLMREHQEDYLIHDFLSSEPNLSPTYRGYAYPHIYNTYFAMYRICAAYPDLIDYKEDRLTYLLRAYNILKALYSDKVAYNWATGLMGEITTPDIIDALYFEGLKDEAKEVERIMGIKYNNFKNTKYPYGSEYSYDNTGEEAVYTLAKMNHNETMMHKIDLKTRACRGLQPVWYHYANPVTICGENWWNFQYTAALAGYCMDDYLRYVDCSMSEEERAVAQRVNYGGKLANFTCINSGQIDSDIENIGTVSWTYQAELGHSGGQGTGGGKLHNGWRQMAGEADLGLFGALEIISADVARDPVFGLFGYGCEVTENKDSYTVNPRDALFMRLNFINEHLSIEMTGATYQKAVVDKNKEYIELNVTDDGAFTQIKVDGLKKGVMYALYSNGRIKATSMGEEGYFSYMGDESGKVVIKKAPHVRYIEPYTLPYGENVKAKRGKIEENVFVYFEGEYENVNYVGDVKIENNKVYSDGTVKSYVRLSNAFTNGVDDFVLGINIGFEKMQKDGCRVIEFSDMSGKNLSVVFGRDNELGVNINGKFISSGVYLPEKYEGYITLKSVGGKLQLSCDGDVILSYETDLSLKDLGEVQRNYIGRGSDEATGSLNGFYSDFVFSLEHWSFEAESTEKGKPISAEEIVYDRLSPLPKSIMVTYSDGFKRRCAIEWGIEADGYITGYADTLEIKAEIRNVNLENNLAPMAKAAASYCAPWESVDALNDGKYTLETSNPSQEEMPRFGTWTRDSSEEWIEYTWDEEKDINAVGLVFFDDGGGTRAPVEYVVEYLDENGKWQKTKKQAGNGTELKKMNITSFEKVKAKAIRVVMQKGTYAGLGVLEWEAY
ncbi:MAG: hypothetical protein IJC69_02330 [Clostridia bacterium]|nr:hypothetical protein [Clostridia bacterium]